MKRSNERSVYTLDVYGSDPSLDEAGVCSKMRRRWRGGAAADGRAVQVSKWVRRREMGGWRANQSQPIFSKFKSIYKICFSWGKKTEDWNFELNWKKLPETSEKTSDFFCTCYRNATYGTIHFTFFLAHTTRLFSSATKSDEFSQVSNQKTPFFQHIILYIYILNMLIQQHKEQATTEFKEGLIVCAKKVHHTTHRHLG